MMNYFTFDGVDSRDFNTFIATSNMFDAPEENVETIHIPYKNTPLHISEKTFKPFILKALCYIPDNMQNNIDELRNFLKSKFASCRYTEALRPGEFRMARFKSAFEVERSDRQTAAFVLTFECAPQRYIIDNPTISLSSTLSEETSYSLSTPAMPLPITLEGNTTQGANPSPSSPQAIHSVSGDNEIRVTGKNLLLNSDSFEGWEINNSTNISVENGIATFNPQSKAWWCVEANKNMLRYSDINNPISVSVDLRSDANGTLNNGTVYVILAAFNSEGVRVGRYNIFILSSISGTWNRYIKSNISKSSISPVDSYTQADIENGYVGIQIYNNSLSNLQVTHPQLEVGSTATTYEPYKAQVYPINLPVENLCPPLTVGIGINATNGVETQSGISATSDYIAVNFNVNPSYYLSGLDDGLHSFVYSYDASKQPLHRTGAMNREEIKLTSAEFTGGTATGTGDIAYVRVTQYWLSGDNGDISDVPSLPIQLEVGDVPSTYNPYGSPSIELNALGTYKDYFHKANGKWYLHKAIQKIDVGTLTWARRATNIFGSNLPNGTDVTADISAHMSNYFPIQYVTGVVNTQINTIAIYKTSNITSTTNIYISLANIDTVEDLTTWFNSHATELYYPLATPTETEITDTTLISQLNALSKAKTYDGSTTIMQEGTDAQFKLSMPVPTEISSEYFGEPIITVNEVGTIVWNDSLIKVNSAPVTINSQTLQCYYYSENKNNDVEINEFPKYEQGENYIGSTMALTVVPNYWKL